MIDARHHSVSSGNVDNPFPQQRCFCLDCEDGCALVRCRLVFQELQQGFFGVNILKQKTLGKGESRTMMLTQLLLPERTSRCRVATAIQRVFQMISGERHLRGLSKIRCPRSVQYEHRPCRENPLAFFGRITRRW